MKSILRSTAAAAVVLLVSCVHETLEQPSDNLGQEITITAGCETPDPSTKTIKGENSGAVLWQPGDRISVFYGSGSDGGSEFTSTNTENASIASFTGRIIISSGDQYFWCLYPYDASNECDGESVTFTLPTRQAAVAGTFASATFPSMGRSQAPQMGFYNICGGIMIKVQKEGVRRVTLASQDGPIAGKAKVAFDSNGKPVVREILDGSDTIILEAPEGQTLTPGENYYFSVFPHTFSDNFFTLTFETDSEIGTYERTRSFTISRSVFEKFTVAIDKNVVYQPMTGVIRTAEQLVSFLSNEAAAAGQGDLFVIDADIDLTGITLPSAASFAGELDGMGHTLSGISSSLPLFTTLSGSVKNLVLDNSCSFTPSCNCFGAIAGENSGIITGVTSYASVTLEAQSLSGSRLVAGIAGRSSNDIRNCVNKGNVSVAVSGATEAVGVAGICAYQEAAVVNCTNWGRISYSAQYVSAKTAQIDISSALPSIGGISAYGGSPNAGTSFSIEQCSNHGEINYSLSGADLKNESMNRHQAGGIVGSPTGYVANCTNYGLVNASIKNSSPNTPLPYQNILCVGGIGGGDAYFTSSSGTVSNTNYYNCTNEGTITVDSDANASNSAIGGIVGWPGQEAATTTLTDECSNTSNAVIIARGAMKCRVGGIQGGTGALRNCINEGTIRIESCDLGSTAGSICGFHSRGHAITGCTAGGHIISQVQLNTGVGGLIGNVGNVALYSGTGCAVDCTIEVPAYDSNTMGMVVGKFNGNSAGIVLGSDESRIQVSGSIGGNPASASNIYGSANYVVGVHVIHTNFDSIVSLPPDLVDAEINGTAILSSNNTAGLVSNSSTGAGIPGVAVSDGYQVVVTDANGVYQMQRDSRSRKIYYTTPSAYKINLDSENHLPEFFTPGILEPDGRRIRADFTLEPLDAPESDFTLLMIGDPQCTNNTEANRYINETIRDIKATANKSQYANVYAMTLGDITFDSTNMWDRMKYSMSNVQQSNGRYIPFFQTIGNHDHDSTVDPTGNRTTDDYNAVLEFVKHFGPTDYSFDRGNVHIISMDNIPVKKTQKTTTKPNGRSWNYDSGGFSDEQYAWLCQDLANVSDKANKIVMLCLHIQMRNASMSHNHDILSLMTQFKEAHLMIGHTHYQQNFIYTNYYSQDGNPIYEHIHGAACGAWWSSDINLMGGPNGYTIYTVSGSKTTNWIMKGANKAEDYQLRVYDGNFTFTGLKGYNYLWYNTDNYYNKLHVYGFAEAQNSFVAEVFNDDSEYWTVEFWQNGEKVGDFRRAGDSGIHNVAACSYFFNELGKTTDSWNKSNTSHYWYYTPASGDPSSEQNWEVRAIQSIPFNPGKTNTYTCSELTKDYSSFMAP